MNMQASHKSSENIKSKRRSLLIGGAYCLGLIGTPRTSVAASQPPIRLIVPFASGGASDVTARIVGQMLGEVLRRTIIIENMSGAGGSIAATEVIRAKPDGATLLFASDSLLTFPLLHKSSPYQLSQFEPLVRVRSASVYFGLNPHLEATDITTFVSLASAQPGKLNYASAGVGSIQHLAAELFCQNANIKLTHIPFRGASQVIPETVSGRTQLCAAGIIELLTMVQAKKLLPFATTGKTRSELTPDFPTFIESGYPNVSLTSHHGVFASKRIPSGTASILISALRNVVSSDAYLSKMRPMGLEVSPVLDSDNFKEYLLNAQQLYASVIKNIGIEL